MNVLNAIGNVGSNAELRSTSGGTTVAQFSLAITSGYGKNKATTWLRCNVWGKQGETLAPMILKGDRLGVTGEIALQEWDNKDGGKSQSLELNVRDVTLLGEKRQQAPQPKAAVPERSASDEWEDSEIPF